MIENNSMLDFDSDDGVKVDVLAFKRDAQKQLYKIKNPYIGSKRKIIVEISEIIDKHVRYNKVIDLFSGSSAVSLFFKLLGKEVISNDLLTSSYLNALVFVENNDTNLSTAEISDLKILQDIKCGFVKQNYYPKRFTESEAIFLDSYYYNIQSNYANDLTKRSIAFLMLEHYIMDKCFLGGRLNNGQILASVEHRLNHPRTVKTKQTIDDSEVLFEESKLQQLDNLEMDFKIDSLPNFNSTKKCRALNMDCYKALEASKNIFNAELLYLDPPYGGQQSDYAEMFRFCEEYIHQKPLSEIENLKTSKRFATEKDYDVHFKELCERAKFVPNWAISYNDSSWADIDTVKNIVSNFKKKVIVESIEHKYKYRKSKKTASEYLIVAYD